MSKTYKGYELIKAMSDGKIKDNSKIIVYRSTFMGNSSSTIYYRNKRLEWDTGDFDTSYLLDDTTFEVEDNEIEELDINIDFSEIVHNVQDVQDKINELVKAVNQIRKDLNK